MAINRGEKVNKDPICPKKAPKRVYANNLATKNVITCKVLLYLEFMELVNNPPCTARQEIPPEVKPVKNASQRLVIVN